MAPCTPEAPNAEILPQGLECLSRALYPLGQVSAPEVGADPPVTPWPLAAVGPRDPLSAPCGGASRQPLIPRALVQLAVPVVIAMPLGDGRMSEGPS